MTHSVSSCVRARWLLLTLIAAAALCLASPQSFAQDNAGGQQAGQDAEVTNVSLDAVNARITELESLDERTEAQQKELTNLQQTRDWLNKQIRSKQQTEKFTADAAAAPNELTEWKAKPRPTIPEALPENLALPEALAQNTAQPRSQRLRVLTTRLDELKALAARVGQELDTARAELNLRRQARDELNGTSTFREDRLRQIPADTQTARQRLTEIATQLSATPPPDEPAAVTQTRIQALAAERQYLQQRIAEFEQERVNYNARRELLREKMLIKEQEVVAQERLVKLLEDRQNALLQRVADQEQLKTELEAALARNQHPIIQAILAENETFATKRAEIRSKTTDLTIQRNEADQQLRTMRDRLEGDQERVEQVGLSEAIGMRLRTQKARLPNLRIAERLINEYEVELNRAQLRRGELEDAQLQLVDIDSAIDSLLADTDAAVPADEEERAKLREAIREALRYQNETQVSPLIDAYDNYINTVLVPLLEHQTGIAAVAREYRDFIDERILWIQSTRPIGLAHVQAFGDALQWFFNAPRWQKIISAVWDDTWSAPVMPIAGLMVVLALLATRRKMKGFIHRASERAGRITTNFVGDTLTVVTLTVLLSAVWPLLLLVIARQVDDIIAEVQFAENLSTGLTRLAMTWFAASLLRHVFRNDGLAEAHFRWRFATIKRLRRHLRWAIPAILPLAFVTGLTSGAEVAEYRNSLGRAGFILSALVIAVFTYFVMHPRGGVPARYLEEHPNGWVSRLRWLWFPLLLLIPIGLAIASGLGYLYTAIELRERLIWTADLLLIVVVINALFVRWIYLTQRRLAYEQSRKRRMTTLKQLRDKASKQETGSSESNDIAEKRAQIEREEEADQTLELDVDAISTQTRQLLRTVVTFVVIIGVALIWANVFPALSILREVELWEVTTTITAEGDLQPVETQTPITLREIAVAFFVLLITIIVTRNIPGLLEIVVLQRLPFSAGGRYAIRTITQYILGIIGIIVAFQAIGIGWSNVQFLAAAVTVGLGFGLQEIFANFVSGIIILFERPVRVGDTITVGTISGTVTRIRMRATTVLDWDRKELIIPNKEFVTGQIINWSLSDTVMRIIIPVGVSYGADTDLSRDLLMEVADKNANVLRDPPPRALFLGFGDSTLNFELRTFIAHPDVWLTTRDELHHAIIKRFRDHDVEIAFPQRDLHIRSVAPEIQMVSRSDAASN